MTTWVEHRDDSQVRGAKILYRSADFGDFIGLIRRYEYVEDGWKWQVVSKRGADLPVQIDGDARTLQAAKAAVEKKVSAL